MKFSPIGKATRHFKKIGQFGFFSTKEFPERLAVVCIFIVFLYTSIRAYFLSMTHDEAITFLNHALGSFFDIFTHAGPIMSNNHLLNTILIKIFTSLFGISEFVIRIPALIGHGLYLVGIYKVLGLFLKRYSFFLGICLLICHPLMLDLFSCARGYSLGLGFLTLGLYYCFRGIKRPEVGQDLKNNILASTMFALSVLSHLIFLNVFIAMVGVFVLSESIILVGQKHSIDLATKHETGKNIFLSVVPSAIFLVIIYAYPIVKMVKAAGAEFSWGGVNGFWEDTVSSLIKITLGNASSNPNIILLSKGLIITLLLFALSILLYDKSRNKELKLVNKYLSCLVLVLLFCCLSVVLQHYILNIKYPLGRYAIYLIPIFFLLVLCCWENIRFIRSKLIRLGVNSFFYLIIIILLVKFTNCVNLTHFYEWKYDASTKNMVEDIIEMNKDKELQDNSVQLGIVWNLEPSINYYIVKNRLRWMRKVNRDGPQGKFDYYYITSDHKEELLKEYDLKVIKKYALSDTYLMVSNQLKDGS